MRLCKHLWPLAFVLATLFPHTADAQQGTSKLTNKSGGAVNQYEVVVVDTSNDSAFTTTTTERAGNVIGVAATGISNNAAGLLWLPPGYVTIKVSGTVTRGDYVITSTTAGSAKTGGTTNSSGAFGIALETGTDTNIAMLFLMPNPISSSTALTVDSLDLPDSGTTPTGRILFGDADDIQLEWDNSNAWFQIGDGTDDFLRLADAGSTGTFTLLGTLTVTGNTTLSGTLAVNNASITSDDATFALLNATPTTINFGQAATSIVAGAATGTYNVRNATADFDGVITAGTTPTTLTNTDGTIREAAINSAIAGTGLTYTSGVLSVTTPVDAQVAHLNVAETITANWVNTANPWADNEVSDTLTIGSGSTMSAPPAIGGSTPAAGTFTALKATGDLLVDGTNIGITSDADLLAMALNLLTVNGGISVTGLTMSKADASFSFVETDAAVDEGIWTQTLVDGLHRFAGANDALTLSYNWLTANRNGYQIDAITMDSTATIDITSAAIDLNGPITIDDTTQIDLDLTVGTNAGLDRVIKIDAAAGEGREVASYTGGTQRWRLILASTAAESYGSDIGSDFILQSRDDDGALIDNPINIQRESGGLILLGGSSDRDVQFEGDIITSLTSVDIANTTSTTVDFAGAATTLNIGAASGTTTVNNDIKTTGTLLQDNTGETDGDGWYTDTYFVATTNATPTNLLAYVTSSNKTYFVEVHIQGILDTAAESAGYVMYAVFENDAGTLTQVGSTNDAVTIEDTAAWDAECTLFVTSIIVRVTGEVGHNINWQAKVTIMELDA